MSTNPIIMKSKDARASWAEILRRAEAGEATIIEHYNRPVATVVPYRPASLRAVATTYNDRTGSTVAINGVPMADADDYPDMAPSADGHRTDQGWLLRDRGAGRDLEVIEPDLAQAIMTWAQALGYRLGEIVIDPIYPPDAGPDEW